MIGILIDALIVGVIVMFVLKNRKTTQLRCMIETLSYVVSMVFALPLGIKVANMAYTYFFRTAVANKIADTVAQSIVVETQLSGFQRVLNQMPSMIKNSVESYGVNSSENINAVEKILNSGRSTSALEITDIIARPVMEGVFRGVFVLIFFVGILFIVKAIGAMAENLLYTQDRATINTSLAGVFGAFKAICVLTFAIAIIELVLPAFPQIPFFTAEQFNMSFIFKLFYHNNVIMLFLGEGIYPTLVS
ncbi:MAG: hypothetical protein LBL82_05730 [Oscillospiraceae bacterium]|nr:hypothetical protein [Oscillospiraceae bacterium]